MFFNPSELCRGHLEEWNLERDLFLLLLIPSLCRGACRPQWGLKVPRVIPLWSQGETFCTVPSHPKLETPRGRPRIKGSHSLSFNSTAATGTHSTGAAQLFAGRLLQLDNSSLFQAQIFSVGSASPSAWSKHSNSPNSPTQGLVSGISVSFLLSF